MKQREEPCKVGRESVCGELRMRSRKLKASPRPDENPVPGDHRAFHVHTSDNSDFGRHLVTLPQRTTTDRPSSAVHPRRLSPSLAHSRKRHALCLIGYAIHIYSTMNGRGGYDAGAQSYVDYCDRGCITSSYINTSNLIVSKGPPPKGTS